jgi:thiol-disulfide isomerase/thioredoxin
MKGLILLLVLVICAGAYVRSEQPSLWNAGLDALIVPKPFHVDGLDDVAADSSSTPAPTPSAQAPTPTSSGAPAPTIVSGPLNTEPVVVHSAEEADFLTQLNAEGAEIGQRVIAMLARNGDAGKAAWEALDAKVEDYEKKVASNPLTANLAQTRAGVVLNRKNQIAVATNSPCDFGRHRALVRQFLASPFPEVVALGRQQAQPLDLQYTALDGTQVDLARLRGKVVLVDFWASWCGFCTNEVPAIVAAYAKYHGMGLEIVGVTFDDNQTMLLNFTSSHGVTWPQYFGGDHHGNFITKKYDVGSLPTLWLVDKHGCLVNATRSADLPDQVEKVLAEQ